MAILMREIQKICPGKWDELETIEAKWAEVERRAGYPAIKRRYRSYATGDDQNTLVIEIEWENLAAMEAANERLAADSELADLAAVTEPLVDSIRLEFYSVLP